MRIKQMGVIGLALAFGLSAAGCGGPEQPGPKAVDTPEPAAAQTPAPSPARVQSAEVSVRNQGEDAQYINVLFTFDAPADGLSADAFRVTLNGDEVESGSLALEMEECTAALSIHISVLKMGQLEVACEGASAEPFVLHGIVSPGVELETAAQDTAQGSVSVNVLHPWDVRGIAQIQFWENGELVPFQNGEAGEAVLVHGHDFLNIDVETAAANIAAALASYYPNGYRFTSAGSTVTAEKLDASAPAELSLTVLERATLELK